MLTNIGRPPRIACAGKNKKITTKAQRTQRRKTKNYFFFVFFVFFVPLWLTLFFFASRRLPQSSGGRFLADLSDKALPGGIVGRQLAAGALEIVQQGVGTGVALRRVIVMEASENGLHQTGQTLELAALGG